MEVTTLFGFEELRVGKHFLPRGKARPRAPSLWKRIVKLPKAVAVAKVRYEALQRTLNRSSLAPLNMTRLGFTWEETNTWREFRYRARFGNSSWITHMTVMMGYRIEDHSPSKMRRIYRNANANHPVNDNYKMNQASRPATGRTRDTAATCQHHEQRATDISGDLELIMRRHTAPNEKRNRSSEERKAASNEEGYGNI